MGDVAEVKAIKKVFTDMSHVKVNGTKSLIGHCLGAAGGLEAVATIQAIRTGWLHPTLNQVICDLQLTFASQRLFGSRDALKSHSLCAIDLASDSAGVADLFDAFME